MREPLSWLGSWYRYRQRPFLGGTPVSTAEMSFADFIEGYLQDPCPAFANVGSQAKFLEPRPNGTSVDRIFRYEALDECVAYLEDRLNLEIALPRVNVSPDAALSLPESLKTRLADTCAEDFACGTALHDPRAVSAPHMPLPCTDPRDQAPDQRIIAFVAATTSVNSVSENGFGRKTEFGIFGCPRRRHPRHIPTRTPPGHLGAFPAPCVPSSGRPCRASRHR